jgi:hypothetical protein
MDIAQHEETAMSSTSSAVERIVVQATPKEKQAIVAKARRLNMSISDLMRRGADEFTPASADLLALAEVAEASAQRSIALIDETTRLVDESNARIAAMEAKAQAARKQSAEPAPRAAARRPRR